MRIKLKTNRFGASVSVSGYQTGIDVNSNTSYVHVDITVSVSGSTYNSSGNAYISGSVSGQGSTYSIPKTTFKISKSSSKVVYSGNLGPFYHNADGTCGNISVSVSSYITSSTKPSASTTIGMSTIPRATGFFDVSGVIGSPITINISPASSGFTHQVKYKFGTDAERIFTDVTGGTSLTFTPPMDLLQYISSAQVGTGLIWLDTYSNGQYIGWSGYKTLTLSANKDVCSPTIQSCVINDTNDNTIALTGNSKIIVNNASVVSATMSGQIKYYATLSRLSIGGQNVNATVADDGVNKNVTYTDIVPSFSPYYGVCDLVDSRGYMDSVDLDIESIVPYIVPTLNVSVGRTSPTGNTIVVNSLSGSAFGGSFGQENNTLVLKYRYKQSTDTDFSAWVDISDKVTINADNNTYTKTSDTLSIDGFDYRYQYVIEFSCIDKLNTYTTSITITQGLPVYYWDEDSLYDKSGNGLSGEILFNNPSGDSGTITLSQSASNFKMFRIFYEDADSCYQSVDVYNPNGKYVTFTGYYTDFNSMFYFKYTSKVISGSTITANRACEKDLLGSAFNIDTTGALIAIILVIGYR